tara:strand:- start:771 stop:1118 length:348 start_codon:yes stop_codon:yes gene_type:complete
MNNTSFVTNYLKNSSETELIDLVQSSCSLVVTLMIFVKVFDFSAYFSSVKAHRLKAKKAKEKREFDKMKVLFEAMKNNELDVLSLSTDEEEEKADESRLKMTRKKKKQTLAESKV